MNRTTEITSWVAKKPTHDYT